MWEGNKTMKRILKKYWVIFTLYWQEALMYRAELFVWRAIEAMPVLAMVVLWTAVYRQGNKIGEFNLDTLLTYYIIGNIIRTSVSVHFEEGGVKQVNDGTIARFFVRPYSYIRHALMDSISWRVFNLLVVAIPLLVVLFMVFPSLLLKTSLSRMAIVILFLLLAWGVEVLTSLAIVAAAFYFEQARAFTHLKWMLNGIFGGSLLPLSVYPRGFENIARILPFQFKFAVPMEIYLGQISGQQIVMSFIVALAWITGLFIVVRGFWNRAEKRFTSVGG